MYSIGIDIGSTSAKVAVLDGSGKLVFTEVRPTGWSGKDTAEGIRTLLESKGYTEDCRIVATGYGRISVPYADKTITEITCHGRGAYRLFEQPSMTVIDIGGQDTKIMDVEDGNVRDFLMNDKCSAGTGRFLEVMATALGLSIDQLCDMASRGSDTSISSMCTVFAESEVISLIGKGESRENIAFAIVDSIVQKVAAQAGRLSGSGDKVFLTGGLCDCPYVVSALSSVLGKPVATCPEARFAGAIGAAVSASKLK